MAAENNYYYNQLNKLQKKAYFSMLEGFSTIASSFPVPRLEGKDLTDIFFLLRLDHPEIFYVESFSYRYYADSDMVEMIPKYLFPKKKIEEHKKALDARIKKLVRQAKDLREKEKELFIHDFICENVRYDKLKKTYSHEIIGPLGHGVGVCEGIAKSVKILCDSLGIWCVIAVSEANPEKQIKYRHAWNVIKIEGKYYHLDVTFDNSLGRYGYARHDYVNLSDGQIYRDHQPLIWPMPVCDDSEHTYYREKKLSFTKYEDIKKRSGQAVKKGKPFLFHWRGGYLTKEVLTELMNIINEEAIKKNKYAHISLNWSQAVLLVRFYEQLPIKEVVIEETDESENHVKEEMNQEPL